MRWTDEGLVLATRRHGESALLVHLLTAGHGRHAGLVRGGQRPKTRAQWQTGNRLTVVWSARLTEHLGTFQGELTSGYAARFIDDGVRLACLAAACALAEATLPERAPHPQAHAGLLALLDGLSRDAGWAAAYVLWELKLLAELGFGLDLERCAATGAREALIYVSPRSGQAVSAAAGAPYRERLFALPPFLREAEAAATPQAVLDGLALTGFFLERRVLAPQDRKLPPARGRFIDALRHIVTISGG